MKTRRGFSLIELLVVIAIISVLLSILVPSLKQARLASIRLICGTRIHQAGVQTIMYTQDYYGRYPKPQAATYLTEWNATLGDFSGAAAQIVSYGEFGSWPPPPRENPLIGGLENRIPDSYTSWQIYDCANNTDTASWVNWNVDWYNAHTEFSAYFSKPLDIPGSSTRASKVEAGFPIWAENAWSVTNDLDNIDASWHDYSGYTPVLPGADIFIGMNVCRADGSADWVQGTTNRSDNFFIAFDYLYWVVPKSE